MHDKHKEIATDAAKAAHDFKQEDAVPNNQGNFYSVFEEINAERKKLSPKQYQEFLSDVNNDLKKKNIQFSDVSTNDKQSLLVKCGDSSSIQLSFDSVSGKVKSSDITEPDHSKIHLES